MSKGKGQASQSGPQLSTVICGVPENAAVAKLNLNCPIGIYLSYALQALKVELDKKKKELNDQMNMIVPVIPPDTPEDNLEDVTNTAKEDAAREKEKMIELSEKLQEVADKMGASTAYNAELLDEGNCPLQCQEKIELNATEILKPYGRYTLGLIQEVDGESPVVLPMIVGATPVAFKKGK